MLIFRAIDRFAAIARGANRYARAAGGGPALPCAIAKPLLPPHRRRHNLLLAAWRFDFGAISAMHKHVFGRGPRGPWGA